MNRKTLTLGKFYDNYRLYERRRFNTGKRAYDRDKEIEQDYIVYDKIVENLNLTDNMKLALEYRIAGLSYTEIGRKLGRAQSTVLNTLLKCVNGY